MGENGPNGGPKEGRKKVNKLKKEKLVKKKGGK